MKRLAIPICLLVLLLLAFSARADEHPGSRSRPYEGGALFGRVVRILRHRLPGKKTFIEERAGALRGDARACESVDEERRVVFRLLAQVPTSHLSLVSGFGFRTATADLGGRDHVRTGLVLVELDGRYFADAVQYGGPAHEAGIRRGDEVTALDGVPVRKSPRLDFRTDDAYLPDPPTHFVRCEKNVPITFSVRTRRDQDRPDEIVVQPAYGSTIQADRAAVRVLRHDGEEVGYVSVGLMVRGHVGAHLRDAFRGPLAGCDEVVVDIRGRGGSPEEIWASLAHLGRAHARGCRLVLLIDARTRSAKEILAQRVQAEGLATLVGERTAGAVRRSRFYAVGGDTWLLCPAYGLRTTFSGELNGVTPDVRRADALPYAHGVDPILEAGLAEAVRVLSAAR